jgi:hypothetical protein
VLNRYCICVTRLPLRQHIRSPDEAADAVAKALEAQYEQIIGRAAKRLRFKLLIDPTNDKVLRVAAGLRDRARPSHSILVHFNGHGVPAPRYLHSPLCCFFFCCCCDLWCYDEFLSTSHTHISLKTAIMVKFGHLMMISHNICHYHYIFCKIFIDDGI